mmetsp:Transcript_18947/g.34289  ORF Transcript_18947/g.34289 Transcript_18947/m.34289 type:complete len:503 (+) Transcript_18947:331-1839(+)
MESELESVHRSLTALLTERLDRIEAALAEQRRMIEQLASQPQVPHVIEVPAVLSEERGSSRKSSKKSSKKSEGSVDSSTDKALSPKRPVTAPVKPRPVEEPDDANKSDIQSKKKADEAQKKAEEAHKKAEEAKTKKAEQQKKLEEEKKRKEEQKVAEKKKKEEEQKAKDEEKKAAEEEKRAKLAAAKKEQEESKRAKEQKAKEAKEAKEAKDAEAKKAKEAALRASKEEKKRQEEEKKKHAEEKKKEEVKGKGEKDPKKRPEEVKKEAPKSGRKGKEANGKPETKKAEEPPAEEVKTTTVVTETIIEVLDVTPSPADTEKEVQLTAIRDEIEQLKTVFDEAALTHHTKFEISVGAKSALSLMNTMGPEKLYLDSYPSAKIIWAHRLFFQFRGITLPEDDNQAWERIREYLARAREENFEQFIIKAIDEEFDFSNDNIDKIELLTKGREAEITPQVYTSFCAMTGLFMFVIKEAAEYAGVFPDSMAGWRRYDRLLHKQSQLTS